jgi:hypothetical protein
VQQPAAAPRSSAVVEHAPPAAVASTPIPPLHTAQILERLNPLIPPESDDWPVYLSLIGRFHRVNCLALRVEAWDLLKRVSPPFAAPAPPPPLARVLAPIMRPRHPESHRPQDHRAFQIAEPPARRTRKRPSGA